MDRTYREIYQRLYDGPDIEVAFYVFQFPHGPLDASRGVIRGLIESAEDTLQRETDGKVSCRPDAKLLLLENFSNMIAAPIRFANRRLKVRDILEHDIRLLMTTAKPDEEGEISGHAIVEALSHNWRGLRISEFKIWD